jgi:hypothetical protein
MVRASAETTATGDGVNSVAMMKRMSLLGAALVAIVLIANLLRGQPPPTEESPPSELRAVDPRHYTKVAESTSFRR